MKYTYQHATIIAVSGISLIIGMLFYAFAREIIVIRTAHKNHERHILSQCAKERKNVTLHFYDNEKWQSEKMSLIWESNSAENIKTLANQWLTLLKEEKLHKKTASVESVLINTNGNHAYISFDRFPFDKQQSAYNKWMLIEGLLKTLLENEPNVNLVHFLVRHEPLIDSDLDFCNAWPITGFIRP